jgi:pimeloyl-ACP methyl ester carboxylesterase
VPTVNGRIITDRLPDARLEIVDCGHLFILTDPAGTAARIESFLHGERAGAAVRHAPAAGRPLHN